MKVKRLHSWQLSVAQASDLQRRLTTKVSRNNEIFTPLFFAGVDIAVGKVQGMVHPRRFGLASHLGIFLDTPTIGCAKSLLCGSHKTPGVEPGCYAEVLDKGDTIGAVLRTRLGVKPVYVSIGHKVNLKAAIQWVLECCRGYRLLEPSRLAHLAAGGNLGREQDTVAREAVS